MKRPHKPLIAEPYQQYQQRKCQHIGYGHEFLAVIHAAVHFTLRYAADHFPPVHAYTAHFYIEFVRAPHHTSVQFFQAVVPSGRYDLVVSVKQKHLCILCGLGILQKPGQIICPHHHNAHSGLNAVLPVVQIIDGKINRIKGNPRLIQIKYIAKFHLLLQRLDKIRVICRLSHGSNLIQRSIIEIDPGYVTFQ